MHKYFYWTFKYNICPSMQEVHKQLFKTENDFFYIKVLVKSLIQKRYVSLLPSYKWENGWRINQNLLKYFRFSCSHLFSPFMKQTWIYFAVSVYLSNVKTSKMFGKCLRDTARNTTSCENTK